MNMFQTPKALNPSKFTYFNLLAPEIRIKIWAYTLPGPRIVDVHYDHAANRFVELSEPVSTHLIHVNREAREEVLKYYAAWLGTKIQHPLVYADLKIDVIKLNFDAFRHWKITDQEFINIRHLEISDREIAKVETVELIIRLDLMPNLKQLIVVDPRSPFIMRPFPPIPAVRTLESMHKFCIARGEFYLGLLLEKQCVVVWDRLVEIDKAARMSLSRLSNFTTGMVGITADGQRRYRMVGYADHIKA